MRAAHAAFPDAAVIQVGVRVIDEHGAVIDPLGDKVKRAIRPRIAEPDRARRRGPRRQPAPRQLALLALHGVPHRARAAYPFRDGLPIIQDLALVIDMVAAGETLVLDPAVCFSYRRHTESASSASLLNGRRLPDERRYYAEAAAADAGPRLAAGGPDGPAAVDAAAARVDPAPRRPPRALGLRGLLTHAFRA